MGLEAALIFMGLFAAIIVLGALLRRKSPATVDNGQAERNRAMARQRKFNGAWNEPRVRR